MIRELPEPTSVVRWPEPPAPRWQAVLAFLLLALAVLVVLVAGLDALERKAERLQQTGPPVVAGTAWTR